MAPLLFQLRAANSDVDSDILNFFSYNEEAQTADMTIFREISLSAFQGIKLKVNNDQFNSEDPENNDINIKFSQDFFDGPLKDLFNNTFEIVTGTTSINTTQFPNATYIQTILSDQNFKIEYWPELATSGIIDKLIGYKATALVSNEDAVSTALPAKFSAAINEKLAAGKTAVSNNGVYTEYGLEEQIGNEFKNTVTKALKKALVYEASRLTPALNNAGNYVDFNTTVFQSGDLIEIIIRSMVNYDQTLLDGTTYYEGNDGVVVRVILKLTAPVSTPN